MSIEVKVPAVGESITTGLLSTWHKKDGEAVASGEILFTLETDKVSTEVNATESGTLKIQVPEGEEVKIGQVVATIEAGAAEPAPKKAAKAKKEEPKAETSPKAQAAPAEAEEATPAPEPEPAPAPEPSKAAPAPRANDDSRTTRKKLSPLRRKIATPAPPPSSRPSTNVT